MATNTEEILMRVGMDLAAVNAKTDELMRRQKSATSSIKGMWAELGGIISGAAVLGAITHVIDKFDDLQDRADNLGVGTDFLQGVGGVASKNAVGGIETFNKAITELSVRLGDAKDGGEEAIKKFQKYGITLTEIKNLNTEQMFYRVSDAISKIQDPAKRSAASFDLLGKSGKNLTGVLSGGAAQLKGMADAIDKLDAQKVKDLADAKDRIEDIKNTATVWGGKAIGVVGEIGTMFGHMSVDYATRRAAAEQTIRQFVKSTMAEEKAAHAAKLSAIAEEKSARYNAWLEHRKTIRESAIAERDALRKQAGDLSGKLSSRNERFTTIEELAGRDAAAKIQSMFGEGGEKDLSSGKSRYSGLAQEYLKAQGDQEFARQRGWTWAAEQARKRMNTAQDALEKAGVLKKGDDWKQMSKDLTDINSKLGQLEVTIKDNK